MIRRTPAVIPYSKQDIDKHDIRAVVQVLRSPFLTQGPKVKEFEETLARYAGARYAVVFSSGTAALHGAYMVSGIGKGDEVITSPLTFAATANMMVLLGARPVFADIDPKTGNLDPREVEKKITKKTKAIVAVDYAGLPAELGVFRAMAKKHGLIFIEDSAQGLGASYRGKKVGALADITMFSFHPVKSITTGEGGALLTNNGIFYEKLLMFRSHGLTKDTKRFVHKKFASWHQEMHLLGLNYRMTDIQAALGVSQMRRLDSFITKRAAAAKIYDSLLGIVPEVTLPPRVEYGESAWHLYPIRISKGSTRTRDQVFEYLRARGLWVQVHYLPVYWHPFYESLGYRKGLCPNAEDFCISCISLPLFPGITKKEQTYVVQTLKEALGTGRGSARV